MAGDLQLTKRYRTIRESLSGAYDRLQDALRLVDPRQTPDLSPALRDEALRAISRAAFDLHTIGGQIDCFDPDRHAD